MPDIGDELHALADNLDNFVAGATDGAVKGPLDSLEAAVREVEPAWSGSWLGYHSTVYYAGLVPPPPGAHFSAEWGIEERLAVSGSTGDWREFTFDAVISEIKRRGGDPDLSAAHAWAKHGTELFGETKSDVESLLATHLQNRRDAYLQNLAAEVPKLSIPTVAQFVHAWRPGGSMMTRDSLAASQGLRTPPHLSILAEVFSLRAPSELADQLSKIIRKMARHLGRQQAVVAPKTTGSKVSKGTARRVFIGHGRSLVWRELKDFIQDRLQLQWDEFNRVPTAGKSHVERLSEMLDSAAMALVVMTGEDETQDGRLTARLNVVHEVGLFQGRLGFRRAIVLLEEGCEEFSNIAGLSQIRFPKSDIAAKFEEIRKVIEREGLTDAPAVRPR